MPEHHDLIDLRGQRRVLEQQPVRDEGVPAVARARARFGEQREPGLLGEETGSRPGVVPRDDDGVREHRQLGAVHGEARAGTLFCRTRRGCPLAGLDERLVELQVQVRRSVGEQ